MIDFAALFLLGVFAVLFSMGFQYLSPRVMAYPRFARFQGSYAGRTGLTALSVLVLLVAVSFVMSAVARKPSLPSA